MTALILSRRDVDFMLYEWLDVVRLTRRACFSDHSRQTFDGALDLYTKVAREQFAPHFKKNDRIGPEFVDGSVRCLPEQRAALRAFADAGLLAACQDEALGGMALPYTVERAGLAFVIAANAASIAYAFLTMANANLLLAHGTEAQVTRYVPRMMQGAWTGTMCLSETQAGSSLADIATRAERAPDGRYRVFGNKMWISGGDHDLAENIVHLVLAKVPTADGKLPPGVAGISLFIVPKFLIEPDGHIGARNDIIVSGLNHKMGYRGTSNCVLNFGDGQYRPMGLLGAVGELVGEEGRGLSYMFHMMNEARIGIGLTAVAIGYTGYLQAVEYARNRRQGRRPVDRDPARAPVRLVEHADVRRMLLAQKALVEGGLGLTLYSASLVDEERSGEEPDRARCLLDLLTPITKSWPSKWCVAANDLAIQVHGGYGYTQDFNVEQLYRDNRLNPIHEGTVGIQAADLLGRRIGAADGAGLAELDTRIAATVARAAAVEAIAEYGPLLSAAWQRLRCVTAELQSMHDAEERLANASCYLDSFGHIVVAWLWLDQALAAAAARDGQSESFYRGKLEACRYFFRWELPRVDRWLQLLVPVERTPLEFQDDWF
ncbi:MAG: acyl-CoA dehydrogenase [Dehalococcoidia bacterium]